MGMLIRRPTAGDAVSIGKELSSSLASEHIIW